MRVIYVVRAAQLLATIRALWMLYSVSHFCERAHHPMTHCPSLKGIPFATPEQIEEFVRMKHQRPASNRNHTALAEAATAAAAAETSTTAPTTQAATSGNTVAPTTEEMKEDTHKRRKRNELTLGSKNSLKQAEPKEQEPRSKITKREVKSQRPDDSTVEHTETKEKPKSEDAKPKEIVSAKDTELHEEQAKIEEVKVETAKGTSAHKEDKVGVKGDEVIIEKATEIPDKTKDHNGGSKGEEVTIGMPTEATHSEVKATEGTPVEIKKEEGIKTEKVNEGPEIVIKHDYGTVDINPQLEGLVEHAHNTEEEKKALVDHVSEKSVDPLEVHIEAAVEQKSEGYKKELEHDPAAAAAADDQHHHQSVKKDLNATDAKTTPLPPKLAPIQQRFVLEHADTYLQEVRCLEMTTDDYFGKDISPYSQHLKGLAFVGPVLVVIAIYLVCTILRTRLAEEPPAEFTSALGCIFHLGMWLVVGLSLYFIANHWVENWKAVSNDTFLPEFPCTWNSLIMFAGLMMMTISIETWFSDKLYYDIVFKQSYRVYEVIDNTDAAADDRGSFSRTNVY